VVVGETFWRNALAQEVVNICKTQDIREDDCTGLVKTWLTDIKPEARPTIVGVLTTAKRSLYGLTPLD
jgi:hypothetical protein